MIIVKIAKIHDLCKFHAVKIKVHTVGYDVKSCIVPPKIVCRFMAVTLGTYQRNVTLVMFTLGMYPQGCH
jgi:hypothetical protein